MTRDEVNEEIVEWRRRLEKALLTVENNRRWAAKLPPLPDKTPAYVPGGPVSGFRLLTLKVWALRYGVTPEFLVEHITERFRVRRQRQGDDAVRLGLNVTLVTGQEAREHVEKMVASVYPNHENRKMAAQPPSPVIRIHRYGTLGQMMTAYGDAARRAQARFDVELRKAARVPKPSARRHRKSLQEPV